MELALRVSKDALPVGQYRHEIIARKSSGERGIPQAATIELRDGADAVFDSKQENIV
jgi:hypothetical protein